jgi:TIR domain
VTLEAAGVRCWVAPRDISPGAEWGEAIIEAVDNARVMVPIFSSNTKESRQVRRDVEHAVNRAVTIMPIRIDQATPTGTVRSFVRRLGMIGAKEPAHAATQRTSHT